MIENPTIPSDGTLLKILSFAKEATVVYLSRDLKIGFVNEAMLKLWNKSSDILHERLIIAAPEFKPFIEILERVWDTGKTYIAVETPANINNGDNIAETFFDFEYRPILDDHGKCYAIINTATNVTARRDALKIKKENEESEREFKERLIISNEELTALNEEYLAGNEEQKSLIKKFQQTNKVLEAAQENLQEANIRLAFAMEAGGLGATEVDFVTRNMTPTEQFLKNYGRGKHEKFTYDQLFESIVPQYRDEIAKLVDYAVQTKTIYTAEYPITWPDGTKHWIAAFGKPRYDENGKPVRIVGLTADITEQVSARQALQESEERFRTMAEGTDVMIAVSDETGATTYFNQAWSNATGKDNYTLLKYGWFDLMHQDDRENFINMYNAAYEKFEPWKWEFRLPVENDSYQWFLARGSPRFHADGIFAGYISSTVNITDFKENEQRKSAFIGMVSHELKSPIASINGYLQVLNTAAKKEGNPFLIKAIDRTIIQVKKMSVIISGFLDASRYESGRIHLNKQSFDLGELIKEVEEESLTVIASHKVVFAPVDYTLINADRDKISQVINNLINNAVKYSPPQSVINVSCITKDNCAEVCITDQGMGISKENQQHLFERYYRVEGNHMNSISGFGIGLYICKEIIERHDGRIWVDTALGTGSRFYFSLPVA